MSIALMIIRSGTNDVAKEIYPIATEQVFEDIWLPIASSMNATWIPLFMIGIDIPHKNITDVVNELKSFRDFVSTSFIDKIYKTSILERTSTLIDALMSLMMDSDEKISIFAG